MNRQELTSEILDLTKVFFVTPINLKSCINPFAKNSKVEILEYVEFLIALENRFNIIIQDNEDSELVELDHFIGLVYSKISDNKV